MKLTICTRWRANPNRPHSFQNSYDYIVLYRSEDSCAHKMVILVPSNYLLCWLLSFKRLSSFEHVVQYLFKHVSFWYPFLEPYLTPYQSKYTGVWIRSATELGASTLPRALEVVIRTWELDVLSTIYANNDECLLLRVPQFSLWTLVCLDSSANSNWPCLIFSGIRSIPD